MTAPMTIVIPERKGRLSGNAGCVVVALVAFASDPPEATDG